MSLPDGRELWFFGDTYLGTHIIHNSLVIERNGVLTRTLHEHRKKVRNAFMNPVPADAADYGFWPGSMVVSGTTLQVIGLSMKFTGNGTYSVLGNSLATFGLPNLKLLGLQSLSVSGTDWSGGLLHDGGYTYIYGSSQLNTYSARVVGNDLTAPWSYYDGSGWTSNAAAAVPIENIGTASHFSVSRVGGFYVFIAKTSWFTNEITAAFACSPVGPFGPPQPIYSTPESSQFHGVVTYGAFAHPELSSLPKTLVVSYDVGAVGPPLYRPRFLDVTFP